MYNLLGGAPRQKQAIAQKYRKMPMVEQELSD